MNVRQWWDLAREDDQEAVLLNLLIDRELAGMPWAFLPDEVKELLIRRVRIHADQLDPDWQRSGLSYQD
jgi:hypothetical protein